MDKTKQYLYRWFHGQPYTAEEADSWWRYLEYEKPRQLRLSPEQAYEASREFFADVLSAWHDRHPEYASLSEDDLWEKLHNFYYNFLRSWRARPSREHREVVCSAYEAPERTEENSEAMEAREVSCGEIVREGALDALDRLSSLYQLPSTAWLAAEGGFGGALIVRLLNRRLPSTKTLELLLRILILHPLPLPSDLRRYRKPLVAHIARSYWANGKDGLLKQEEVAARLRVTASELSKAKQTPPPSRPSFTSEDADRALAVLETELDQELIG